MSLVEINKELSSLEKAVGENAATAIIKIIELKIKDEKGSLHGGVKFRFSSDPSFVFAAAVIGFIIGIVFMVLMNNLFQV